MDIFSHAIAGASTGLMFNRPIAGALIAVAPDVVIAGKRRLAPTRAYDVTHSLPFTIAVSAIALVLFDGYSAALVCLCLLSHIVLDINTHGKDWAPPLLYPFTTYRDSYGHEWEFFNTAWWTGLITTIFWSGICIVLSQSGTGFRLLQSVL